MWIRLLYEYISGCFGSTGMESDLYYAIVHFYGVDTWNLDVRVV